MAKQKKVHDIAKELGVDSKAIIAKCVAEGISDLKTHNSTVKFGLEQTILQWFRSVGATADTGEAATATATAVEEAEKIDPAKAKASRARKKASTKVSVEEDAKPSVIATTVTSKPSRPAPSRKVEPAPSPEPVEPVVKETSPPPVTPPKPPVHEAKPSPAVVVSPPPPATPAAPATPRPDIRPAGQPNVPTRPQFVRPVGIANKPTQAVLKGPKLIRVEKPENLEPPRPRRASGSGGPISPAARATNGGEDTGISRSRGPARGCGAGAGPSAGGDEGKAPAKRRSLSTRRGRSAEALPVGPTKFTEQDLAELDSRLNHASGFLKQRRRDLKKHQATTGTTTPSPSTTGGPVQIAEPITIKSLSSVIGVKATDIIKYLFTKKGIMATLNSAIGAEAAMEVALEYDIDLVVQEQQTAEQVVVKQFEDRAPIDVRPRPPVVTVLGHVDHGKTSLLDRIRKADVAAHEAGGITQHVGAYRVTIDGSDGKKKTVVFLDTPGHQAFTSMRARGAKMTDLVVLVVAADDGVMPQTIESINHAKAAEVPIIVVLNKIDKAEATEANIRKIFGQLAEHGLNPTEWGGNTEVLRVSATQGTGINDLLEVLDYQAALLELQADYGGTARGTVIEAQMQPGRGPVARVLVEQGRMSLGNFIVIGRAFGRVRDMTDEYSKAIIDAGPATPLELSGIDMIPDAGDKFYVTNTLGEAEEIATHYREAERNKQLASQTKVTLDNFASQMTQGGVKELRVVLKADVQGSIDVLKKSVSEIGNQEVTVKVIHAAVGGITESDVLLADASDAVIIGFHVVAPPAVREIAEARGVDIRLYRIIYELTDELKKALEGLLEPEKREEEVGAAEVREVFRISKIGAVAGCLVTEGTIQRNSKIRVIRDGLVVTEDRNIDSLRRVKDDVREVRAGLECGIRLQGFDDLKPGDRLACYNTKTFARKLE